jgi:hypothetical protein
MNGFINIPSRVGRELFPTLLLLVRFLEPRLRAAVEDIKASGKYERMLHSIVSGASKCRAPRSACRRRGWRRRRVHPSATAHSRQHPI